MSLDWSVTKVKDAETVCFYTAESDDPGLGRKAGDRFLKPVTEALIFATMAIGIGEITEKNWREVFRRLFISERVMGAFRNNGKGGKVFFTADEVRMHIGLRTNVSKESAAVWRKRVYQNVEFAPDYKE